MCSPDKVMNSDDKPAILRVIALDHTVDKALSGALTETPQGMRLVLEPKIQALFFEKLGSLLDYAWQEGYRKTVILCDPRIRQPLHRLIEKKFPRVPVLSFAEVATGFQIDTLGTLAF